MKPATTASHAERVLSAMVHIQDHLDAPLALDDLAGVACTSPFHFHRVFRALVGESPSEHIRRLRLERAAHRLQYTDRSILDLALEAHYESHEAFTRAFGQVFGTPPSTFREQRGAQTRLDSPVGVHFHEAEKIEAPKLLSREASLLEGEVRRCPAMRVAFIRHIGPYEEVPLVFERLINWASARGLVRPESRLLGVAHDDPSVTPPDRLRFDSCLEVGANAVGEGEVGIQEFPAGDYAIGTHFGPFETLSETYSWLGAEFIPSTGRCMARQPAIELYLSNPQDTLPHDLRTEIRLPLEPPDGAA